VTKTVQDYTNGTPTNSSENTTQYSYDGSSHMLTSQADLVSGAYEKTQWSYGVTTRHTTTRVAKMVRAG
jgi:hypothetical protein